LQLVSHALPTKEHKQHASNLKGLVESAQMLAMPPVLLHVLRENVPIIPQQQVIQNVLISKLVVSLVDKDAHL